MSIYIEMDKDGGVCVCVCVCVYYNQILLSYKKEWNPICSNMDWPKDDYTKWSNPEKNKYHMISFISGI